ncbi:hypothetical protein GCM10025787_13490 [Saccharopolyspora rosea]|uniref:DUF732 domain-containing protein n=1 Tax=Saccharopolyspora rosea TaxID=524884 RepID=A0ABW3FJM6_9PSEU
MAEIEVIRLPDRTVTRRHGQIFGYGLRCGARGATHRENPQECYCGRGDRLAKHFRDAIISRILPVLLGVALAPALASCGGEVAASTDLPQDEQDYLNAVYRKASEVGSGIHGYGDEKNLDLARRVCAELEGGRTPAEVAREIRQTNGHAVAEMATYIVGNAETYLCPSH